MGLGLVRIEARLSIGPSTPRFEGAFQIAWGCATTPYVEDMCTIDTRVDLLFLLKLL